MAGATICPRLSLSPKDIEFMCFFNSRENLDQKHKEREDMIRLRKLQMRRCRGSGKHWLRGYAHHFGDCNQMIFLLFGSSLAHLEPELELFEVWEFGSWCHWRWWWFVARFSPKLQTALALVLDKLKLSCLPTQSLLPLLYFPLFSPFYRCALFTILWHWNILGGESQEHPPILYEFNFGSLTNASLREIERELTDVSWFSILFIPFSSRFCGT